MNSGMSYLTFAIQGLVSNSKADTRFSADHVKVRLMKARKTLDSSTDIVLSEGRLKRLIEDLP